MKPGISDLPLNTTALPVFFGRHAHFGVAIGISYAAAGNPVTLVIAESGVNTVASPATAFERKSYPSTRSNSAPETSTVPLTVSVGHE